MRACTAVYIQEHEVELSITPMSYDYGFKPKRDEK